MGLPQANEAKNSRVVQEQQLGVHAQQRPCAVESCTLVNSPKWDN
jgi:hypothetical protein